MTKPCLNAENEARASIYWWFATLFTKEMELGQLASYRQGEGAMLLKNLAQEPALNEAVNEINSGLAVSLAQAHPELELAADFCQLFLTDAKKGAPPYASVYRSAEQLLFQEPHEQMCELLHQAGMAIDPDFNEPADHLAIQLDYLGNLIMRDGENNDAQRAFIEEQLLSWLPSWQQAVNRVSSQGFYTGLANLLVTYIRLDLQYI